MKQRSLKFIENIIDVWKRNPDLKQPAKTLKKDKKLLVERVDEIFAHKRKSDRKKNDEARSFLLSYALARIDPQISADHFVLFKFRGIVVEILEDFFGVEDCRITNYSDPQYYEQTIGVLLENQEKAAEMITKCVNLKNEDDITEFLRFFSNDSKSMKRTDKTLRFTSMVWFAYLLMDLIRIDEKACENGTNYIKAKLGELLDTVNDGKIINEERGTGAGDYEDGIWAESFFSYLQGKDRKPLVERIIKQFNFDNESKHSNRRLSAEHKKCLYRITHELFCR